MSTTTGWETLPGEFPWPPQNVQVVSPLFTGAYDICWDDPSQFAIGDASCGGMSNTKWDIVGVNIYRSEHGERGPYHRINKFPVGSLCFRDFTDNVLVEDEIVLWDGAWTSKGDAANERVWSFKTRYCPIVKQHGQAIHANSPSDVVVKIDGVVVPVEYVFGPTGEITLINTQTWDLAREKLLDPLLPSADGSTEVTVSYRYNKNLVRSDLDRDSMVFYRLTTVAIDASTPSGLVETPLGHSPPVSPMQVETLDYIWREAIKRNTWILEQGGERVKLFIRKVTGVRCPCRIEEGVIEHFKQPDGRCEECYGTGYIGGFEGPIDVIIVPDEADRRVTQTPTGRHLEHTYEVWTGPSPALTQRDFIVKQTGERYSVGPVRRPAVRGLPLQQHFQISYLDEADIRYKVPTFDTTALVRPETRYTKPEDAPCVESDPYPVGSDYQATPMTTEANKIPDEREQRGRTPVWQTIQYGGGS